MESSLSSTQRSLKDVNKLLKLDPSNTTLLAQKHNLLQKEIEETKNKLNVLKEADKQAKVQLEKGELGQEQYDALQREIVETEQHLKTLKKTAGSGSATLEKVSTVTGEVGNKMKSAGQAIMPASAAMAGLGAVSVNTANEFESAMSQAAGALNMPMSQMGELRDLAIQTGQETIFSAKEAGQAITELAKGGLSEADIKAGALKATMDLAASSGMELGNAANVVVQAMGAFGLSAEESAAAANALAGAAAASSTDVEPLTQGLSQAAAQAKNAGWSIQETTAVLGKFADAGINGSDAGTSLKTMLQRLAAPTDTAAKEIEKLGINTRDSQGNLLGASDMAEELQNKLGGLSPAARDAALQTIFGSDAMRAATVMMNSGSEGLATYIKATNDQEAAQRLANSQMGEGQKAIEEMKGSLETAAITIGSKLAPVITQIVEFITDLVNKFSELPSGVQNSIVVIGGLVAIAGPLLMIIGQMSIGISAVTKAFSNLSGVGKIVQSVVTFIGGALKGLFALIMAHPVIAVITAIVAALVGLYAKCEWFRDGVHNVVSAICSFFTTTIPAAWDVLVAKFQQIPAWWSELWGQVKAFFSSTWNAMMNNPVLRAIVDTIISLWKTASSTLKSVWDGIKTIATNVWEMIKNVILAPVLLLIDLVTGDFEKLRSDAENIWNNIKTAGQNIWNAIKSIVTSIITGFVNGAKALFEGFKNSVQTIWNTIKSVSSSVWNSIKSSVISIVNNLKTSAINAFQNLVSGIRSKLSSVTSTVKNGFQGAISFLKSLPSQAVKWGKDFMQGMINGIKSMINRVVSTVKGVADKIRSFLHFSRPDEGPLRDYETWMPDFMEGLAKGIKRNIPVVERAVNAVTEKMSTGMNLNPQFAYENSNNVNVQNDVTVMIGNEQFKGYIVNTATKGISNMQKRYSIAKGGT